jgi:Tol biopolymer transport system component
MALVRGTVGNSQLWMASPVDADPKPYLATPFSGKVAQISGPEFSPDGSKLAVIVSRNAATAEPELWIVPLPSGSPTRVPVRVPGLQGGGQRPSWMRDNRHLILSADHHLYAVDVQKGDLRSITTSTVWEIQPAVSPDGRRIAFAGGTMDSDIVEISLEGSLPKPLLATARDESDPAWSPLNSQFAYVTTANGLPEIWLRGAQDAAARPLVRQDTALAWNDLEKLHFSPDGRHISFDLYGDHHVVAISDIGGGRPVILDQQSTDQHGASWSPDGNWIAHRRLNGAKWELVKRPLGGGDPIRLEEAAEGGSNTEWSPTGEWICHPMNQTLRLISADGSRHAVIQTQAAAFGFSRDGAVIYAVRRNPDRKWELATFFVPGGREKAIVPLDLPAAARVAGFSLNSDGKAFITSVAQSRFDIWFLDGFAPPHRWLFR